MPVKITKIDIQKKRKSRYSIFAGEQFIAGVSQDTLLNLNIYPGKILSDDDIQKIKEIESNQKLMDQAFRFLSRRAHSKKELSDKLINKGYSDKEIKALIIDLVDKGYLDDIAFARIYIENEINMKYTGPILIKDKLGKRGINFATADQLLTEIYSFEQCIDNCRYLIQKKYKMGIDFDDRTQRKNLINFLRNKGYNWEHISNAIPNIIEENNHV